MYTLQTYVASCLEAHLTKCWGDASNVLDVKQQSSRLTSHLKFGCNIQIHIHLLLVMYSWLHTVCMKSYKDLFPEDIWLSAKERTAWLPYSMTCVITRNHLFGTSRESHENYKYEGVY